MLLGTAVLSLAAYVRASWRSDELILSMVSTSQRRELYSIFSDRGRVGLKITRLVLNPGYSYLNPTKPQPRVRVGRSANKPLSPKTLFGSFGPIIRKSRTDAPEGTSDTTVLSLPAPGLFAVSMSLLTLIAIRAYHVRALSRVGKCRRCGYDWRATPGFCPECGPPAQNTSKQRQLERYNPMVGATEFLTAKRRDKPRVP